MPQSLRTPSSSNLVRDLNLASPFSQAPVDILFTIFLAYIEELKGSPPLICEKHPTISISQVCRQWRDLSLGMATLWSVVDIDIPPNPTRSTISALEKMIDAFIFRSGECPLTIRVRAYADDGLGASPAALELYALVEPTAKLLLAHCHRWKELEVTSASLWLGPDSPLHSICTLKPDRVPNLRGVMLNFYEEPETDNYTAPCILQCPTLRRLELKGYSSDFYTKMVDCKSLTELIIGDPTEIPDPFVVWFHGLKFIEMALVVNVLRQCPNLVHCSLTLTSEDSTPENDDPIRIEGPISLPRLQSLALYGQWIPPGIASSFDLPQLTDLSMLPQTSTFSEENVIVEWVRKVGSQLTDFTFDYAAFPRAGLPLLLPYLPNVARLRVIRYEHERLVDDPPTDAPRASFDQAIWDGLTPRLGGVNEPDDGGVSEGGCWCPHLQVLHCVVSGTGRFREKRKFKAALAAFIVARRTGTRGLARLQEIKLEFEGAFTSISTHELVHTLAEAGVGWKAFTLVTSFLNEQ
ncbi:hypothetical protein FA13DRAFT_1735559 [Coprinellus micaceus]|uniref:F-box domain-containing protein n=1 Tax=Coprinellus micaceus TaxID=71717 RepID=A0A4Y7T2M8_COPMI|nr:hypothetical protein FA13DRAFT_1735559 [Coprinellus micaceus]